MSISRRWVVILIWKFSAYLSSLAQNCAPPHPPALQGDFFSTWNHVIPRQVGRHPLKWSWLLKYLIFLDILLTDTHRQIAFKKPHLGELVGCNKGIMMEQTKYINCNTYNVKCFRYLHSTCRYIYGIIFRPIQQERRYIQHIYTCHKILHLKREPFTG